MILPESGGICFPSFIKEKRRDKQHQKELRINANFLNTGKYQCNDEPDDNLQHRNGDARKFVKHRRGNDTGQNDENEFKDFQENSSGSTGFRRVSSRIVPARDCILLYMVYCTTT